MGKSVWENLKREHDSLKTLIGVFATFQRILEDEIKKNGDYLEPGLVQILKRWSEWADSMLTHQIEWKKGKLIPSLVKQYEDVLEELEVFRVGKPVKGGVPYENGDEKPSPPPSSPRGKRRH